MVPWNGDYNRDDVRAIEILSANGIGTVIAVAKLYGAAAIGDAALGLTTPVLDELAALPGHQSRGRRDRVLRVDAAFSLGMWKATRLAVFGSSDKAFGTTGFGGSFGFADPDTRVGFTSTATPRELALRQTLFRDVLGARSQT